MGYPSAVRRTNWRAPTVFLDVPLTCKPRLLALSSPSRTVRGLQIQTGDQQLALTAAGDGVNAARIGPIVGLNLTANCKNQGQVALIRYVDHGHNSPAQLEELSFFGLGMLEFL